MRVLFAGGLYSFLIIFWWIISLVIFGIFYRRLSKQMLIMIGTLLGSIVLLIGIVGYFSGLGSVIRTIGETASSDIERALMEGVRYARIPFSISVVATILYFIITSILISIKKQPFKKWAVWVGFLIFLFISFLPAYYRYSMNAQLLKGVGRIMGHGETIPPRILPVLQGGKMAVITSFAMLMAFLLVAILATIHKRTSKPRAKDTEKPPAVETTQAEINREEEKSP